MQERSLTSGILSGRVSARMAVKPRPMIRTKTVSTWATSKADVRETDISSDLSSRLHDADSLEGLKSFTRDLMTRMEQDLRTELDWVAVDHFDTLHPHTHIVLARH